MGITRLNHAVLFVRDLERSVAFYNRGTPIPPDRHDT
jgi:catechol 2,3-dioxygenase-like lactoylglutathione lyase family enzyme